MGVEIIFRALWRVFCMPSEALASSPDRWEISYLDNRSVVCGDAPQEQDGSEAWFLL